MVLFSRHDMVETDPVRPHETSILPVGYRHTPLPRRGHYDRGLSPYWPWSGTPRWQTNGLSTRPPAPKELLTAGPLGSVFQPFRLFPIIHKIIWLEIWTDPFAPDVKQVHPPGASTQETSFLISKTGIKHSALTPWTFEFIFWILTCIFVWSHTGVVIF